MKILWLTSKFYTDKKAKIFSLYNHLALIFCHGCLYYHSTYI